MSYALMSYALMSYAPCRGTCPARRIANWYREIGQEAYW